MDVIVNAWHWVAHCGQIGLPSLAQVFTGGSGVGVLKEISDKVMRAVKYVQIGGAVGYGGYSLISLGIGVCSWISLRRKNKDFVNVVKNEFLSVTGGVVEGSVYAVEAAANIADVALAVCGMPGFQALQDGVTAAAYTVSGTKETCEAWQNKASKAAIAFTVIGVLGMALEITGVIDHHILGGVLPAFLSYAGFSMIVIFTFGSMYQKREEYKKQIGDAFSNASQTVSAVGERGATTLRNIKESLHSGCYPVRWVLYASKIHAD